MFSQFRTSLLMLAAIAVLAAPAFAEEPEVMGEDPAGMNGDPAGMSVDEPVTEREAAIREVPTYEDTAVAVSPQEAFLTLAEDYIFLSEIGGRGAGNVPIWPRGAMKVGPVQIFPYLEGRIGWTNNVFDDRSSGSSWYAVEGGGIAGRWDLAGGRASVTFGADYRHTDYFSGEKESFSEWTGGAGFGYTFANGVWMRAGVKWEHLVDPVDIEFVGDLRRDQVYPYIDLGFDNVFGNKFNLQFGVRYFNAQYAGSSYDTANRSDWNANARLSYPFLKDKTRLFLQYDFYYGRRDSDRINDLSSGHELTGGIEGEIPLTKSERLTGEIGVGYRNDLYASPRLLSIGTGMYPTDDNRRQGILTVYGVLRYLAGPKTSMDLRLLRTMQFSATSNFSVINRADFGVTHNCLKNLVSRLGLFAEHNDPSGDRSQGSVPMTRFGFGVGSRFLLQENADLDFAVNWARRNTSKKGYDTTTLDVSLGLTIHFQ